MRGIQFKKNGICVWAILLFLICMPLLSSFSYIDNGSIIQNAQPAAISLDSVSSCGADKVNQNSPVDIYFQQAYFFQDTQQLSSCRNNSCAMKFCGLSFGSFLRTTASFISLSDQITVCKIKYFLLTLNSPNAPPYTLS